MSSPDKAFEDSLKSFEEQQDKQDSGDEQDKKQKQEEEASRSIVSNDNDKKDDDADAAARQKALDEEKQRAEELAAEEAKAAKLDEVKKQRAKEQEAASAAAAATASSPPKSSSSSKGPRPPVIFDELTRQSYLASPAFVSQWIGPEHVVVGGGGGGKRFELPNVLVLLHVPTVSTWHNGGASNIDTTSSSSSTDPMKPRTDFFTVVQTLNFEEAGTIQGLSGDKDHLVVAHNACISLVKINRGSGSNNNDVTLSHVCRVALVRDLLDSDAKVVALCAGLIFAAQDNSTVAVFRVSTLAQWAQREQALQKKNSNENDDENNEDKVAISAGTVEEVRAHALSVCEFACGGRVQDLKVVELPASKEQHMRMQHQPQKKDKKNKKSIAAASASAESSGTLLLALCGRDKMLRIGHFDAAAREFVPLKMLGAGDLGFDAATVVLSGKSVKTCAFAPRIRPEYDPAQGGKWVGATAELFVAVHPLRGELHAARIFVTATTQNDDDNNSKPAKLTARVAGLCKASGCEEGASASLVLPTFTTLDEGTPESAFVVGTVEGSVVEFVFRDGVSGAYSSEKSSAGVRRFVRGVHDDAITSMTSSFNALLAYNSNPVVSGSNNDDDEEDTYNKVPHSDCRLKESCIIVSTDISKRISFHTWDPRSKCSAVITEGVVDRCLEHKEQMAVAPQDLFAQKSSSERMTRVQVKRTLVQMVAVFVVGAVLSAILGFLLSFIF